MPRPAIDPRTEGLRALARLIAGAVAEGRPARTDPGELLPSVPTPRPRPTAERARPPDR